MATVIIVNGKRIEIEGTINPLKASLCNRYKIVIDDNLQTQEVTQCPSFQ